MHLGFYFTEQYMMGASPIKKKTMINCCAVE